jgi:cobaltochelatase CobN
MPVVVLGGEAVPDVHLQAKSTAPAGVVSEALAYLVEGGAVNLRELHRFLCDTLLMAGGGFAPPAAMPEYGVRDGYPAGPGRPMIGVVYYRAHELAGNTAFVDTLCVALDEVGANALPVFCGSLRRVPDGLRTTLSSCEALIVTVLAAGGTTPADASAGGDDEVWSVDTLAELDAPVPQRST